MWLVCVRCEQVQQRIYPTLNATRWMLFWLVMFWMDCCLFHVSCPRQFIFSGGNKRRKELIHLIGNPIGINVGKLSALVRINRVSNSQLPWNPIMLAKCTLAFWPTLTYTFSILWRHWRRTFHATFNRPRTRRSRTTWDRGSTTAVFPVTFGDRCSDVCFFLDSSVRRTKHCTNKHLQSYQLNVPCSNCYLQTVISQLHII